MKPVAKAVHNGQLPAEVEQLAGTIARKYAIDRTSARWYALGCMHTADAMLTAQGRSAPHEEALAYLAQFAEGERQRAART